MKLEGSLDAFSLPDIFSLLSMTKKTGGLHIRRDDEHGVVWLGDGLITGGASDLSRQSLGRRIAGGNQVDDNLLTAAIEEIGRNAELGFARALRDSRAIDEGDLHSLVSEHILDTVFDLMRWPEGVFEFVVDEANIDDVGVAREVEEVVTEARLRLDIWAAIDERVAAPETVLSVALDLDTDPAVQRDEWALLALVDGQRSVGDLVAMCGRGQYAVVVALAELVNRGLIRPAESEGVAALVRRQALIATLESHPPAVVIDEPDLPVEEPQAPAETASNLDPEASAEEVNEDSDGGDDDHDDEYGLANGTVTDVDFRPRSSTLARDVASVAAQRTEAFRPDHEPEHPEPLAAAVVGGGPMAGTMLATAIERDPSVNKSLLLRLIAGVRGL